MPETIEWAVADGRLRFEERPECPSCGARGRDDVWVGRLGDEPVRSWIARHYYSGDPIAELGEHATFRLVRCRECAMLFHAHVLCRAGLSRLYAGWIDDAQIERFEAANRDTAGPTILQRRRMLKQLMRLEALVGRDGAPLRLLDFGCGQGELVALADAIGHEAWGVDTAIAARGRARGLRTCTALDTAREQGAYPLDAVTLIETLEHVMAPVAVLEKLAALLAPGGALLVEVPDARPVGGPPRTFEEFRTVHPLEHVNAFTPATLERTVRRAGFVPVRAPVAHATTRVTRVLVSELAARLRRPSTSQFFVRADPQSQRPS